MEGLKNITTKLDNGILLATITRPESLNALNIQTMDEIRMLTQSIYEKPEIKAAIITGSGEKAFVAGADIKEIAELNELNARKFAEKGQEIFALIENCEKPIIAAVNGFALGGGCELAMACHIRVASSNAKFGLPEVSLGVIPGYGGTQRLTQLVGKGRAMEIIMTGDMVSAINAKNFGLVNHVTDTQGELIPYAKSVLNKITTKGPIAIGMAINCVNMAYTDNGYQTEANSFSSCCKTQDFKEGTTAFIEKRKAEFKGN
ncbi:MAG: enoyl-CoA hydratase-related protein [Cyclobacteriaceae bacterium]|nr:enoyl-CoA hydratase-related protein [Cyclobacteriaceae bacterium]